MDALTLLRRDHDTIKPLLREIKETTDRAEQVFDNEELEALGERMARRKETAREEMFGPARSGPR
jgi:mevalonate kinase